MESNVTAEDIRLGDAVADVLKVFGIELQTESAPAPWFQKLLIEIIDSTLREYQHSKIGLRKHTPMLAWACRNLLELNVLIKYVLKSEADARRFIAHRLVDGIEIFKYAKTYQEFREPGSATPAIDETIRLAEEQKRSEGINETRFLSMAETADKVGMAKEYTYMSKVTSKLVHPTAWSILAMNDQGEFAGFKNIFFFASVRYMSATYEAIKIHVDAYGLKPRS
jgi:hypothetical protein